MKEEYKVVFSDLFQWFAIVSLPLIVCFFWPNHELRAVKMECMQLFCVLLFGIGNMIKPIRNSLSIWPAVFMLMCLVNVLTHGMSGTTMVGLPFVIFSTVGIYTLLGHLKLETIQTLKRAIIFTFFLNALAYLTEYFNTDILFNMIEGQNARACGFMCYPASFALLSAIAFLIAWDLNKWMCLPIGIFIILSKEFSVILGLFIVLIISLPKWYKLAGIFIGMAIGIYLHEEIFGRIMLRWHFWQPVVSSVWARPIDGWGLGAWRSFSDQFLQRGNWSELHCEPLDTFFSLGFVGLAVVRGWINSARKRFTWNLYSKSFVVYSVTSFFHSPFHFADTLWLGIIIYCMWEIERAEICLTR